MSVYFDKGRNKFRASIKIDGTTKYLGRFSTEEEALKAVKSARRKETAKANREFKELTRLRQHKTEANMERKLGRIRDGKFIPYSPLAEFFDVEPVVPEPTLWDRIKSLWQKPKN